MPKKKRSEAFAEKSQRNRSQRSDRISRNKKRELRRKKYRRRRIISLVVFVLILLSTLFIYQKFINTPQRSINKAVEAIKDLDYDKQNKYFDKIVKVEDVLKQSYSTNKKEQEEFLKANFKNLHVLVKDKKKTKDGLEVDVEVSNVCYIDVFDNLKKDRLHETFIKELSDEKQEEKTVRAKLLLDKKFSYYKIYESRDFVDGILGGALKYSEDEKWGCKISLIFCKTHFLLFFNILVYQVI